MPERSQDAHLHAPRVRIPLKFGLSSVVAIALLGVASWCGRSAVGAGQVPPPKSQSPPPPKQSSPPPAAGNQKAAPPKASGTPAAPSVPKAQAVMPQGPITGDDDPRVKAAIIRAANYLRAQAPGHNSVGDLSLAVHALAKIHEKFPDVVAADDPQLQLLIQKLRAFCAGGTFRSHLPGGHDNYESGVAAMALAAADGQLYRNDITAIANYILGKQMPNGAWSYESTPTGDTSMTQYAILGLWEAGSSAGITIPRESWDRTAQWLVRTQVGNGGFAYHPPDPSIPSASAPDTTHTMTVASLGSLYICRDHLPGGKRRSTRGVLLQVQDEEEIRDSTYKATTTPEQINDAIAKATAWLEKNFTLDKARGEADQGGGRWYYYYLYAFERFGTLANLKQINGVDWYAEGARMVLARQGEEGAWSETDGPIVNTGFAVLFLIRSTHISQKIHKRRLGRGTMVSGRGLPTNLAELEQTAFGFKAKAASGKTGDLLQTIETGKAEQLDSAALGLLKQKYDKKWTAIGEEGDRLKKMYERGLKTKNSEVLKASLKLLALTGDYRVVPILIDGMYYDEDPKVMLEARKGLCLISRKFNGFGTIYPEEATKEEWLAEIERWRDWYRKVRPESSFEDEVEIGK